MSEFKQSFNEFRYLFPFTTFRSPVLIHINEAEGWGAGERWGLERSQRSYWGTQKGCSIFFECEDMFSLFLAFLGEWKVNNSVEYDISMGEFSNVLQFFLHSGVGTTATLPVHLQPTDNVMFI